MSIYKIDIEKTLYGSVEVEAIGDEQAKTLATILEEEKEVKWIDKKIEIKNIKEIKL